MGIKISTLYDFARSAGGATAVMRLAMRTMIGADKVTSVPDSPENIAKVRAAVKDITGKEAPEV